MQFQKKEDFFNGSTGPTLEFRFCDSSAGRNFYVHCAAVFLNVRIVVITEMEIIYSVFVEFGSHP